MPKSCTTYLTSQVGDLMVVDLVGSNHLSSPATVTEANRRVCPLVIDVSDPVRDLRDRGRFRLQAFAAYVEGGNHFVSYVREHELWYVWDGQISCTAVSGLQKQHVPIALFITREEGDTLVPGTCAPQPAAGLPISASPTPSAAPDTRPRQVSGTNALSPESKKGAMPGSKRAVVGGDRAVFPLPEPAWPGNPAGQPGPAVEGKHASGDCVGGASGRTKLGDSARMGEDVSPGVPASPGRVGGGPSAGGPGAVPYPDDEGADLLMDEGGGTPTATDQVRQEWVKEVATQIVSGSKKWWKTLSGVASLGRAREDPPDMERLRVWTLRVPVDDAADLMPETGGSRRLPDFELVKAKISSHACDTWRESDRHPTRPTEFVVVAFESADKARAVRARHYETWSKQRGRGGGDTYRLEYGRRVGPTEGWRRDEQPDRLCITGVWAESEVGAIDTAILEVNKCLFETGPLGDKPEQIDTCERFSAQAKHLGSGARAGGPKGLTQFRVWVTVYGEKNAMTVVERLSNKTMQGNGRWRVSGSTHHKFCHACKKQGHLAGSGECWADKYVLRVDASVFLHQRYIRELVRCSGATLGFSGLADRHLTRNLRPKKFGHLVFDDELSRAEGAVLLAAKYCPTGILSIPLCKPNGEAGMPKACAACGLMDSIATRAGLSAHTHGDHALCPASTKWVCPGGDIRSYVRILEERSRGSSPGGSPKVFWNGSFFTSTEDDLCQALAAFQAERKPRRGVRATGAAEGHASAPRAPAPSAGRP